jgi:hypothetical protein
MSLRKPPKRTRALLAANRRNSRKSTGPRTELGKWHSAGNAVRHYRPTSPASCIPIENREIKAFEDFYFALREAIMPGDNAAGTEAVLLKAAQVWRVKRSFDRWIATRTEEDWLVLAAGAVPRPRSWRLKLRRPGLSAPDWLVTASVSLRWGRGPGHSGGRSRRPATEDHEKAPSRMHTPRMHAPRMHAMVSVHSTGPFRPVEALEGPSSEPEWERTKPESYSSQSASENMSAPSRREASFAAGCALADRLIGWLTGRRKRTKPESDRNGMGSENMSAQGGGGIVLGASDGVESSASPEVSDGTKQTKPEYHRKEGAYKNMSKTLAWLGAAASLLLKRCSNSEPHSARPARGPDCPNRGRLPAGGRGGGNDQQLDSNEMI